MTWFGILVAIISSKIISSVYVTNIEDANKIAQDILLNPAMAQPEPMEKAVFFGGIIITVLSLFLFYFILDRFLKKNDNEIKDSLFNIVTTINVVISCYFLYYCFITVNPFFAAPQNSHDALAKTNFDFYFFQTFLYKRLVLYTIILFPLLAFLLIKNIKLSEHLNLLLKKTVFVLCLGLSVLASAISIFKFPYTYENKYDFNAIYYSVVQVYNGFPLLVDGFTNTYGLYPHFVMPILKLTGLSVLSFSMTMSILLFFCFCFLYYFMNKIINNKLILLFGFCLVYFMCYSFQTTTLNYDAAFSCHPVRWIMPLLLFAYIVYYMSNQMKANFMFKKWRFFKVIEIIPIKIVFFFVFAFGVLWNPDFGFFSFLSLIAFYVFYEFDINEIKKSLIQLLFNVIQAFFLLVIAFILYYVYIKFAYHQAPDFSLLYETISTYSVIGFGMLPMPTTMHPWMLIALIYGIGWVISIINFLNNRKTQFALAIFVLTFLGTIGLSYYQGRSHNWQLMVCNLSAFILLPIYADKLLITARGHKLFIPIFSMSLFVIAFAPFQLLGSWTKLQELVFTKKDKAINQIEQNHIYSTASAIDKLCEDGEKIYILSADYYQGLYHTLSKTASVANPGLGDLYTKKQYELIIEKLKNENQKLFLEPQFYRPKDTKLLNVIGAYYELNAIENMPTLYYYKKREFGKYQPKLINDASTLFYINTNANGNDNFKLYEAAVKPIQLDNAFTIDVIFTSPSNIITNINTGGTILSNLDGYKGFVVQQQKDNPSQFIFGFKGRGILCNVELNKQTKMTFKVDGINISCYVNDMLQSKSMVTEVFENSQQPICVGSIQNMSNFFLGNIDEIKISNGAK